MKWNYICGASYNWDVEENMKKLWEFVVLLRKIQRNIWALIKHESVMLQNKWLMMWPARNWVTGKWRYKSCREYGLNRNSWKNVPSKFRLYTINHSHTTSNSPFEKNLHSYVFEVYAYTRFIVSYLKNIFSFSFQSTAQQKN